MTNAPTLKELLMQRNAIDPRRGPQPVDPEARVSRRAAIMFARIHASDGQPWGRHAEPDDPNWPEYVELFNAGVVAYVIRPEGTFIVSTADPARHAQATAGKYTPAEIAEMRKSPAYPSGGTVGDVF